MKGLTVALGGICVAATLAIGLSSTAYSATEHPSTTHLLYEGCSQSQQGQISAATSSAQTYAARADAYLTSHSSATPRYTTWFGTYTPARKNTVASHFHSISQTRFDALTYDCHTCQQPAKFGYVNPAQTDHVFLCPPFWNAPATGTDSKAGTLINLVGQFSSNGGLKDSAQGQPECQTLARNNPDAAAMNAASHEYFAENNPPLA
jgi:peptidyl-Lys metalloendopeptidase